LLFEVEIVLGLHRGNSKVVKNYPAGEVKTGRYTILRNPKWQRHIWAKPSEIGATRRIIVATNLHTDFIRLLVRLLEDEVDHLSNLIGGRHDAESVWKKDKQQAQSNGGWER
jgi:hypothetical protein